MNARFVLERPVSAAINPASRQIIGRRSRISQPFSNVSRPDSETDEIRGEKYLDSYRV